MNSSEGEKKPPQQPSQAPQPQPQGRGRNTVLIIIIIIGAVLVLGIAGWLGLRYLTKKSTEKLTEELTTSLKKTAPSTPSETSTSLKVQALIELFTYPNGKVTGTETDSTDADRVSLTMETSDSVKTAYDYYKEMASQNKWTTGREGFASDASGGFLLVDENDFSADLEVGKEEGKTVITVAIISKGELVTSSRLKPTAPTAPAGEKTGVTPTNSYIVNDSDTRIISESELTSLTPWQLKVARNEIYARHGREFVHKDLQCYFTAQSWYSINPNFSESQLSNTENKNIATILNYEEKINSPLLRKDSGC